MATKRQLAAIMFTDITGFSAMMEADEEYARKIRQRHREVFKDAHERFQGKILQYYGDGTLSIFESAAAAVECAVEMQIEFRKDPEVPLRIGIHTGDISYDDEGAYGDGLNIAARIERLCIPGGVFITAKVYDDIKNHKWLTAISLGMFNLRNIYRDVQVYAVTCKGLDYPSDAEIRAYPEFMDPSAGTATGDGMPPRGRRRKGVAFILAFLFGLWGIHRFYLGQRIWGVIYFLVSMGALMYTIEGSWDIFPPIAVVAILAFIDAVLLLAMPKAEFDYKYNKGTKVSAKPQRVQRKNFVLEKARGTSMKNPALLRGIRYFKKDRYHEAIEEFHAALELNRRSTAAHFNLACCHSVLRDPEDAYHHLAKAVELGFDDYERIHKHEALAYLRTRDDFQAFVDNNYRVVEQLPEPQEDLISQIQKFNPELLDKIELLGEKLERGDLTREEFDIEKRRILGNE